MYKVIHKVQYILNGTHGSSLCITIFQGMYWFAVALDHFLVATVQSNYTLKVVLESNMVTAE
jgi:hypothetical protein